MLGRGGAGVVYKAEQKGVSRVVALKVLDAATTTDIKRFQRECQTLSKLEHPGIVRMFAWGTTHDGAPYLAMEYVKGQSLFELLRERGKLPVDECVAMAAQVCDALTYAHSQGVVHRDIKPSNIMFGDGIAKLLDFGLAKFVGNDVRVTRTESIVGTPVYMAPEQFMSKDVTPRSDIYSLGCTLYEALCGREAFGGETAFETFNAHAAGAYKPLPDEIPEHVRTAVRIALHPDPQQRFASAEEMKNALLGTLNVQAPDTVPQVAAVNPKRSAKRPAVLIVLAIVVAGFTAYFALSFKSDPIVEAEKFEKSDPAKSLALYKTAVQELSDLYGDQDSATMEALIKLCRVQVQVSSKLEPWRPTWDRIKRVLDTHGRNKRGRRGPNGDVAVNREKLAMANRIFGEGSIIAAGIESDIAHKMSLLEQYDEAIEIATRSKRILDEARQKGIEDYRGISLSAWTLAVCYDHAGDGARAEKYYLEAIHNWTEYRNRENETVIGETFSDNLVPLFNQRLNLADLYYRQQKYESAYETLRPVFENNYEYILKQIGARGRAKKLYAECQRLAAQR